MNKKIYFHADDFGRSKIISKNIYKCIKLKIINSISVMVGFNEYYFEYIKKSRLINIKLHLNLTENYPSSSLSYNYSFFKLLFLRYSFKFSFHKEEVKKEIEKQIIYFKKKFNITSIKIDSHEHVHVIPWINDIILDLKEKHKIIELREPIEKYYFINLKDFINTGYLSNIMKFLIIIFLSKFHRKKKGNLIKSNFTGLLYTGFQNFVSIKKGISLNKNNSKTLEVLIHPGYTNNNEVNFFKKKYFTYYSSDQRIKEYKIASSKKIIKMIR